jgi:hypothetical protein
MYPGETTSARLDAAASVFIGTDTRYASLLCQRPVFQHLLRGLNDRRMIGKADLIICAQDRYGRAASG